MKSLLAESFPEDILLEILLKLPAKSLARLKCVCKRWRTLLSDPDFAKSHLQRLKAGDMISSQRIFKTTLETIDYEALDGSIGGDDVCAMVEVHELRTYLVGSCDGLVCLFVNKSFLLYNPTTKNWSNWRGFNLFQLDEFFMGFGYDSRSDDYKIVLGYRYHTENWQVFIFSLKYGSWRKKQVQLESHLTFSKRGTYWNGALHWCVADESDSNRENIIMSFDLSEEKFDVVLPVHEVDRDIGFNLGLGIHGNNLFIYHGTVSNDRFEAWITSDYKRGGSWTKLFSVCTHGISRGRSVEIVACTRSGKIVFLIDMYQMTLFNPKDDTYKDYPISSHARIQSTTYLETLIFPVLAASH